MNSNRDPLMMSELDPQNIAKEIEKSKTKLKAPPTELELKKEQRLAQKEQRLNKSLNAGASMPQDFEYEDVSALLDKLGAYKERFPELKSRNKITPKSTVDEVKDEIHYIEMQLGSQSDGTLPNTLFIGAMRGLEYISSKYTQLNLNLQGLGNVAQDNVAQFSPLLDELSIKYGAGIYMSPEVRLVLATGSLIYAVHSSNNGNPIFRDMYAKMNAKSTSGNDDL